MFPKKTTIAQRPSSPFGGRSSSPSQVRPHGGEVQRSRPTSGGHVSGGSARVFGESEHLSIMSKSVEARPLAANIPVCFERRGRRTANDPLNQLQFAWGARGSKTGHGSEATQWPEATQCTSAVLYGACNSTPWSRDSTQTCRFLNPNAERRTRSDQSFLASTWYAHPRRYDGPERRFHWCRGVKGYRGSSTE